jgi:leader peptidase (prepilin peptidase)/N-methyltransferase
MHPPATDVIEPTFTPYTQPSMIRILGTILAALLGMAFGSFLNVCLSRLPEGESIVNPRSHCRSCGRTLAWWENLPLLSWLALRGRCRTCHAQISWRYPLVELVVGALWAIIVWQQISSVGFLLPSPTTEVVSFSPVFLAQFLGSIFWKMVFTWTLVGLAALDAERLWLPDWVTLPGVVLGFILTVWRNPLDYGLPRFYAEPPPVASRALGSLIAILVPAAIVLLIRWTYWLIRHREGIGLGDAKLMAMLGAWLGLSGSLLSFAIGVMIGAVFALVVLAIPTARRESKTWLLSKMPLGTFICLGGIISALWGQPLIAAYMHLVGL